MYKVIPLTVAVVAAISMSGCTKAAEATADPAQIELSIRAQEAQWQKDYAAKDVNALASHYADNAALVSPGEPVAGSDVDRRKALQAFLTDAHLKVTFASDAVEVAKSGDLAYSRGHYSMTTTDTKTGKPVDSTGSYLTVYRKQADDSWKAVEDFSTPGPATKS